MALEPISKNRVIWEQGFSQQICVKIPFDGKKCAGISAWVRLIEINGSYFIELQLFGERRQFEILNVCYPALELALARLNVCTSDVVIENNQLKSLKISVDGCVGIHEGPINVEKCWRFFDQTLSFFYFTVDDRSMGGNEPVIIGYNDITYTED